MKNEEWRFAVDKMFNVTHWANIHDTKQYHCIQSFFGDSYINMSVEGATGLLGALTVSAGGLVLALIY
jgi:hypothetical protein